MNLLLLPQPDESVRIRSGSDEYRHLTRILGVHSGDTIRVGVPDGPRGRATVVARDDVSVDLSIDWDPSRDVPLPLTVLLGHPRPPVLQRLWRDLASARVERVVVFHSRLGERSYFESSIWSDVDAALCRGLSQGCHTARPRVDRARSLEAALRLPGVADGDRICFVGSEAGSAIPLASAIRRVVQGCEPVTVCIGSERGFVPEEHLLLARAGGVPVRLTPSVLRTETAAVALAVSLGAALAQRSEDGCDTAAQV